MATKGGISIDPSVLQNGSFSAETSQESRLEHLLGPLLGACAMILFVMIITMYLSTIRSEEIEEEEATTKGENRHIFLKTHMNIKMYEYTDSVSECIDDEEAQKQVRYIVYEMDKLFSKQLKSNKMKTTPVQKYPSTIAGNMRILWMWSTSMDHVIMKEKKIFAQFVTNNSKLVKK